MPPGRGSAVASGPTAGWRLHPPSPPGTAPGRPPQGPGTAPAAEEERSSPGYPEPRTSEGRSAAVRSGRRPGRVTPAPGRATAPSCHGRCRAAGARRGGAGRRLQELRAGWRGAVRGRSPARRRRQEVTEGRRGAGPARRLPRGAAVSQPGHRRRDGTGRGPRFAPLRRRRALAGCGTEPRHWPRRETDGEPACSGRPPPARVSARCAGCTPGRSGAAPTSGRARPAPARGDPQLENAGRTFVPRAGLAAKSTSLRCVGRGVPSCARGSRGACRSCPVLDTAQPQVSRHGWPRQESLF